MLEGWLPIMTFPVRNLWFIIAPLFCPYFPSCDLCFSNSERLLRLFSSGFPLYALQPTKCLPEEIWRNHKGHLICFPSFREHSFIIFFCPKSKNCCFIYFFHSCDWLYQKIKSSNTYSIMARSSSLHNTLLFKEI